MFRMPSPMWQLAQTPVSVGQAVSVGQPPGEYGFPTHRMTRNPIPASCHQIHPNASCPVHLERRVYSAGVFCCARAIDGPSVEQKGRRGMKPALRCKKKCPVGKVCCVDVFGAEHCCDNCESPLCGVDAITARPSHGSFTPKQAASAMRRAKRSRRQRSGRGNVLMRLLNGGRSTVSVGACCSGCAEGKGCDGKKKNPHDHHDHGHAAQEPWWKAAGHCCESCAKGGECEGGCGDSCTCGKEGRAANPGRHPGRAVRSANPGAHAGRAVRASQAQVPRCGPREKVVCETRYTAQGVPYAHCRCAPRGFGSLGAYDVF